MIHVASVTFWTFRSSFRPMNHLRHKFVFRIVSSWGTLCAVLHILWNILVLHELNDSAVIHKPILKLYFSTRLSVSVFLWTASLIHKSFTLTGLAFWTFHSSRWNSLDPPLVFGRSPTGSFSTRAAPIPDCLRRGCCWSCGCRRLRSCRCSCRLCWWSSSLHWRMASRWFHLLRRTVTYVVGFQCCCGEVECRFKGRLNLLLLHHR